MSSTFKKVISVLLGVLAVIVISITLLFAAFSYILSGGKSMQKDQVMIDYFYEQRSDFETLVTMSNQDSKVIRIAPSFTRLENNWAWPRPESEIGFSQERWNEYRTLFQKIDSGVGIDRDEDGSIYITTYAYGLVTGGNEKGYVYLPNTPEHSVDSIDNSKSSAKSNVPIYRHITDKWYLYYSWDD